MAADSKNPVHCTGLGGSAAFPDVQEVRVKVRSAEGLLSKRAMGFEPTTSSLGSWLETRKTLRIHHLHLSSIAGFARFFKSFLLVSCPASTRTDRADHLLGANSCADGAGEAEGPFRFLQDRGRTGGGPGEDQEDSHFFSALFSRASAISGPSPLSCRPITVRCFWSFGSA